MRIVRYFYAIVLRTLGFRPRPTLMDTFVQQLINGLTIGSIYALIALGYTMVYGILRFINFAHGDIYMAGAYAGFFIATGFGFAVSPSVFAFVVTLVGAMAIAA